MSTKPHTFLSSTCYDLGTEREVIADYLRQFGHEPVLSDSINFPVTSGKHSHAACLDQVKRCNYFVLLIGGRRGGTAVHSEKSITNEEYDLAVKLRLPIYTFIKKEVWDLKKIYAKNPKGDYSLVVDDTRIFDFIDQVVGASEDNWVRPFTSIADVKEGLKTQFSYTMLLWSENFVKERTPGPKKAVPEGLAPLPGSFPRIKKEYKEDAAEIIKGLQKLHPILSKMLTDNPNTYEEKVKTLWVIARHGTYRYESGRWRLKESIFKDHAWGSTKGSRVFDQLSQYGFEGDYAEADEGGRTIYVVTLSTNDRKDLSLPLALHVYVQELLKHYGAERGLEKFRQADMSIFAQP